MKPYNKILFVVIFTVLLVVPRVNSCTWMLEDNEEVTFCPTRIVSVATDEVWTLPRSVIGVSRYNSDCHPSLSADGRLITFCSHKQNGPPYDTTHVGRGFNVYTARWNGTAWDSVRNAGKHINPASYPSLSPSGDSLFVYKGDKIWMATWEGMNWSKPELLPPPVNDPDTNVKDGPCAISGDGKELYFKSNRLGGYGNGDIWVVRITQTGFDSLTNLGPNVNTEGMETHPAISPDGQRLYFSDFGGKRSVWKFGDADIYISHWTGTEWGATEILPAPVNTDLPCCSAYESTDGRLFLGSEVSEGTVGEEDIWVCYRDKSPEQKTENNKLISSWENTGELEGATFIYDLVEKNGAIYAATAPNGDVFKTTDRGKTWQNTGEITGETHIYSLLVAQDGSILASTYPNGKIFRTTDDGVSWNELINFPYARGVRKVFQKSNGILFAGTSPDSNNIGRVWRSTDNGAHWELAGDLRSIAGGIFCFFEAAGNVLLAGGRTKGDIAFASINNGNTWNVNNLPYADEDVTLAHIYFYYRTSDNRLWTGGWAHGPQGMLLSSTNDGINWDTTGVIYNGENIVARVFDMVEGNDGSYFIGFHPGPDSVVFRSNDKGITWKKAGVLNRAYEALCLLKASDGTIYAGTTPHGDVFKYLPSTGIDENTLPSPTEYALLQNYPNPFNPVTTINYHIPRDIKVVIQIFDILGQSIRTLVNENQNSGYHSIIWDGRDDFGESVSSGVYFYQMKTDRFFQTNKLLLLK